MNNVHSQVLFYEKSRRRCTNNYWYIFLSSFIYLLVDNIDDSVTGKSMHQGFRFRSVPRMCNDPIRLGWVSTYWGWIWYSIDIGLCGRTLGMHHRCVWFILMDTLIPLRDVNNQLSTGCGDQNDGMNSMNYWWNHSFSFHEIRAIEYIINNNCNVASIG